MDVALLLRLAIGRFPCWSDVMNVLFGKNTFLKPETAVKLGLLDDLINF